MLGSVMVVRGAETGTRMNIRKQALRMGSTFRTSVSSLIPVATLTAFVKISHPSAKHLGHTEICIYRYGFC